MDLEHSTVIAGHYLTACVCVCVCGGGGEEEEGSVWGEGSVMGECRHMHRAAQGRDLLHEVSLHLVHIQFGAVQLRKEGKRGGDALHLFMDLEG